MKNTYLLCLILIFLHSGLKAQKAERGYDPAYKMQCSESLVRDKNFYLLTLLQEMPEVRQILTKDKELVQLRKTKSAAVNNALENCGEDRFCLVESFLWSDSEITEVSQRLKSLYKKHDEFLNLIEDHIRPSGFYIHTDSLTEADLLANAWEVCAKGMNYIISAYGNGENFMYPNIDSVTYNVEERSYKNYVYQWAKEIYSTSDELFFDTSLGFAVSLLYINHRDEAARYEPMEKLENKAAYEYIQSVNWQEYDYSAILILGNGSEIYDVPLTPLGKLNLRYGVQNFRQKLAPLIIVSGGHVHPYRTPYCEAIEMKKELMEYYDIPEKNIIIDPHARHTTTNLRNAARLMIKYHVPLQKKALVTTNESHSKYVENDNFQDRCIKELGYLPFQLGDRLSISTLEFLPKEFSLQKNPLDPLDP